MGIVRIAKMLPVALFIGLVAADNAFAGFFRITPSGPPAPPAAVPELDGSGALMAMALVASIGAILFSRSRNR